MKKEINIRKEKNKGKDESSVQASVASKQDSMCWYRTLEPSNYNVGMQYSTRQRGVSSIDTIRNMYQFDIDMVWYGMTGIANLASKG